MKHFSREWFFALLAMGLFVVGCSKKQTLNIGGSTTVLPVVTQAAEQYRPLHPGQSIIINSGGSGVGINQIGKKQLDIGMASRPVTQQEKDNHPQVTFVTHVIGRDAVIPVVSNEIFDSGVQALSIEQLQKIYLGEITNWSQLGGPDRDILVLDKEKSRGTRHAFMEVVMGDAEATTPASELVLGSNNEVQVAVSQSDAAIGFLSFAWQNEEVKGIAFAMEDGSTIAPSTANLDTGNIPTIRELLLITDGEPKGQAKEFIDYILGEEGQKLVKKAGYVPINK